VTATGSEIVIIDLGTTAARASLYRLDAGAPVAVARVEAAASGDDREALLEALGRAAGRDLKAGILPVVTVSSRPWPVLVAGMARGITAESIYKAVQDAGLVASDILSVDDRRMEHERVAAIRRAPKNAVVLGGGVDEGLLEYGQGQQVADMAALLARSIEPGRLPLIYAGSREALPGAEQALAGHVLTLADNPRPVLEEEHLEGLVNVLADVYRRSQATPATWPWGLAYRRGLALLQAELGGNVLGVDLDGTSAEVASVINGQAHRTGYSESWPEPRRLASRTLVWEQVAEWLPWAPSDNDENIMENFRLRPATVAVDWRDALVRQAYHRVLLSRALAEHQETVATLRGLKKQRTIGDVFADRQTLGGITLVDMGKIGFIVASGGAWLDYAWPAQAAAVLIDGLQPAGLTNLLWDKDGTIVAAGVLDLWGGTARSLASRAAGGLAPGLVPLGAVAAVASRSGLGLGSVLGRVRWESGGRQFEEPIQAGAVRAYSLPPGERAEVTILPSRGVDAGAGPGQPVTGTATGGPAGLIVDGRGRPVRPRSGRDGDTWRQVARWLEAIDALPESVAAWGRQQAGKAGVR